MAKPWLFLLLLGAVGCDPNVVDAVREPVPVPVPVPVSPLESSLIHRYSFDGDGNAVLDSKGAAHGQLFGAKLAGTGALPLAGGRTGEYVNLPNGIVSGLHDATFEAWLTWNGGGSWQRIFDFGGSTAGEDMPSAGSSYLFLTTASSADTAQMVPAGLRVAYSQNGVANEDLCYGSAPFPIGVATHVAVVIDPAAETMSLYRDGALVSECPLTRPLSAIDDVNNWLGHSNFSADVDLSASYDEFRIYAAALTASEITDSFAAGPDAKP
jgi:Concanavalin A-like lectin/glucanases superfamily